MEQALRNWDQSQAEYAELFSQSPIECQGCYWLRKLKDDVDPELGVGNNAWALMFADDDRIRLSGQSAGFDVGVGLGLQIAVAVQRDPLGDPLPAIRSALERAAKQYRWYENEAKK